MGRKLGMGSMVFLTDSKGKTHLTRLREGIRFSSHHGYIDHEQLADAEDGSLVETSKGAVYRINRATYIDFVMNIKRRAQIIYPKDTAVMLMWGDVYPGLNILESGIGQGAFSIALLRAMAGQGKLTSYEIREDFAIQAKEFIEQFMGDQENHDIQVRNIYEGIDGEFDRIFLDLPEPWHVVPHMKEGLADGGIVVAYLPTVLQVKQYVDALRETRQFDPIETFEFTKRPWKVEGLSVRPEMWIYNHSAFIIVARKVSKLHLEERKGKRGKGVYVPEGAADAGEMDEMPDEFPEE